MLIKWSGKAAHGKKKPWQSELITNTTVRIKHLEGEKIQDYKGEKRKSIKRWTNLRT